MNCIIIRKLVIGAENTAIDREGKGATMSKLNVLALDCALKTGWASRLNGQIETGVQDFTKRRGESNGMVYIRFNAWLDKITPSPAVHSSYNLIIYEKPNTRGAGTELLHGLITRVQEHAVSIGAEYTCITANELKKHVRSMITDEQIAKSTMATLVQFAKPSRLKHFQTKLPAMAWFQLKYGRSPMDDNESDAAALLDYAIKEYGG